MHSFPMRDVLAHQSKKSYLTMQKYPRSGVYMTQVILRRPRRYGHQPELGHARALGIYLT